MTIQVDSEQYVLRRDGDDLQVGRALADEVSWLETIDGGLLPAQARAAIERGDTSDEALVYAVRGLVQAEVERGG